MTTDDGWMKYGACRGITDPEIFFPPKRKGIRTDYTRAKRFCQQCRVSKYCLGFAIAHSLYEGCWGGMSEGERKALPHDFKVQVKKLWWEHYSTSRPSRRLEKKAIEGR